MDDLLSNWINKYSRDDRKRFVESLFDIFNIFEIDSLIDIALNKTLIIKLIIKANNIDKNTKYMLKECVGLIFKCYKDITTEELKSIFGRSK